VLGWDAFAVVKTLVMEDEKARPLIVLMHGNRKVSTKNLARQIGAKSVEPCAPETANRHSGYLVGIDPQVCVRLLGAKPLNCALAE
jgi:prolyl-tRNA editing enzyme YbaK/EbsC (Cys-tRNA(Pro) deacylase)